MKRKIFFLLLTFLAVHYAEAKKLSAFFSYGTFYAPKQGPYLETYLSIESSSVNYKLNQNNLYQAKVEVLLTVKKNDNIIYFDKYNLYSPEVKDTLQAINNFLDQQRIKLPEGSYELVLSLADKNSDDRAYEVTEKIEIFFPENKVSLSDIELIEKYSATVSENSFSKNGYDLVPRMGNYFGKEHDALSFYVEVYNTDKILVTEPWLINYYVSETQRQGVVAELAGFARQQPVPLKGYMAQIPMAALPSGNYELHVEVKSKANEVLASKKIFFQRNSGSNVQDGDVPIENVQSTFAYKYTNADTLREYLNSLHPTANPMEKQYIDNQVKTADITSMQHFLYNFWYRRDKLNPEGAWLSYLEEVKKVNEMYGTRVMKGYKTDRGRVYLQYGSPNTIYDGTNEPAAYPYQIWHYYKLGSQTNRKFVFYSENNSTNDFSLIHSDAPGEFYNSQWELTVNRRVKKSGAVPFDQEKTDPGPGERSVEEFAHPK